MLTFLVDLCDLTGRDGKKKEFQRLNIWKKRLTSCKISADAELSLTLTWTLNRSWLISYQWVSDFTVTWHTWWQETLWAPVRGRRTPPQAPGPLRCSARHESRWDGILWQQPLDKWRSCMWSGGAIVCESPMFVYDLSIWRVGAKTTAAPRTRKPWEVACFCKRPQTKRSELSRTFLRMFWLVIMPFFLLHTLQLRWIQIRQGVKKKKKNDHLAVIRPNKQTKWRVVGPEEELGCFCWWWLVEILLFSQV